MFSSNQGPPIQTFGGIFFIMWLTMVTLVDKAETAVPTFDSSPYVATDLDEELAAGTALTVTPGITASDTDLDTLYFSLTGADAAELVISGANTDQPVVIRTMRAFDFEAADTVFTFAVDVFDGTTTVTSNTITLTITDLNDNAPSCSPTYYFATLAENANVGDAVTTITGCSDADAGTTLTYSESEAQFQFPVSTSGAMTVQAALDYETTTSHTVTVTVSDGTNTGTAYVIVTVTSFNEVSPAWGATYGPYNLDEHKTVGTTIATLAATDADDDVDGEVMFSITAVTGSDASSGLSLFHLDPVSGVLHVAADVERDPPRSWYDIDVKAADQGSPAQSATQTIRIDVVDVNDQTPVFSSPTYTATVTEGDPPATSVVSLAATDADPDLTFTPTYSISGGDPGSLFQLGGGGNELQIQTAIDLDSGDPDFYTLVVEVADGGTPDLTGTATVYVYVTSSNDADPVFGTTTPTGNIPISESASIGYSVATVTATDADWGPDGDVVFSITSGDDDDNFVIDTTSGIIELKTQLDFETATNNPVLLEITASDNGATVRTGTLTLTIDISDENDNTPSCSQYAYTEAQLETIATGTTIVTLSCSDDDAADTVTYSIISGNTNNDFSVSPAGLVTDANALNYDSAVKSYVLVVRVTDGTNFVDVTVVVDVSPANEDTPSFATNPTVSFSENTAIGTSVYTYTGSDGDHTPHNIISYTMTGDAGVFTIDSTSAEISLALGLDYDTPPITYQLVVTAMDGGGLTGSGTVTVSVLDVNDNSPVCVPMTHTITHNENSATFPDTLIASMACTDADGSAGFGTASLTYSLTQTPAGAEFSVAAGVFTAVTALDYETTQSYAVDIAVVDGGGLSVVVPVSVTVAPVNEGPPVFSGVFSQNIPESTAIGTSVDDVTATDPDDSSHPDGQLTYAITGGNTGTKFTIDSFSGKVTVNAELDRETVASYLLEVIATEAGGTNSATTTLTVNLVDVDENPPDCTVKVFSVTVNEDESAGYNIQTLGCTDVDTSSVLTYSITTGDTSMFSMTADTLQLVGTLDFDAGTRQYDLEITVNDGTNSVIVPGSVTVGAVNEASPIFTSTTYAQSVAESTSVGAVTATVLANDADSADTSHGQVTYSVVSGATPKLTLDSTTGDIIVAGTLDRESTASYTLQVQATDSTNVATATVVITVTDDNDNAPVFSPGTYSTSLSESVTAIVSVITVTASDADDPGTNDNGVIKYIITAGNTGNAFAVDSTSGAITMVGSLDLETTAAYTLTVLAEDKNGAVGALTDQATVFIQITGSNEADPTFGSVLYSATVGEDIGVGSVLTTVAATDADDGLDGVFYYTMPVSAEFYLDSDTGVITVKSALNYESVTNYGLTVTSTDYGSPARSSTTSVTVTVTDVNDIIPDCSPRTYLVQLREDDPVTTAVTTLICSDPEPSPNGDLVYSLVSVNGAAGSGPFTISATGAVTLNSALDYETTASYSVKVEVKDSGTVPTALSTTVAISVMVLDVNEAAPAFVTQPASQNVAENTAVGTSINTIMATDVDTADTLAYSLSALSTKFSIDSATGEIALKAGLDRETTSTYTLTIVATDDGMRDAVRTATHVFTVTVTDSNDETPTFNPASYVTSLSESAATGLTISTVTASDGDAGANGAFTYAIQSGNTGNVFRVDQVASTNGEIIVDDITFLDYETVTSYDMVVIAVDGGGRTGTTTVQVNVEPYNEYTPVFSPGPSYSCSWPESTALGTVVDTVAAADADDSSDGDFAYYIIGPAGITGTFGVDGSTGDITLVGPLDRETAGSHTISVIGVDLGVNPGQLTGTATITVTVNDVNDESPTCSPTSYTASLAEDVAVVTNVVTVVCTDNDATATNNVLTYSISSGDAGKFTINSASGLVQTVSSPGFDFETTKSYTLVVEAVDSGAPALTGTAMVEIHITGINESPPVFGTNPYTCNVDEDAAIGENVQLVAASDTDDVSDGDGTFVYSIFSGNTGNKFSIDAGTGQISVISYLDREPPNPSSYDLVIYATDAGTTPGPMTGSTTVSVTVNDINDNTPSCTTSFHATTLPENTGVGTSLYTPTCSDPDTGVNGVLVYSITSGNMGTAFAIDASTGAITVNTPGALDAESTASFTLLVDISDTGTPVLSTSLTVEATLTNLNEHTPSFSPSSTYSTSVSESETPGFSVLSILATDADSGINGQVEYAITGGNPAGTFYLDPTTGELFVHGTLDRETTASYSLSIQATDTPSNPADALTAAGTVTITITDVNDETPSCPSTPYAASHDEDETVGTLISTVLCPDADTGTNGVVSYSISAGNAEGKFSISSVTGAISLAVALDYETTVSYSLTILAVDGGGPARTGTALVLVTVGPVNEAPPAITVPAGGYTASVSETTALGTPVATIAGTDPDDTEHGAIRWSITAGNTQNKFSIDDTSAVITVAGALNRENTATYTLTIQATDSLPSNGDEMTDSEPIIITVGDENDNFPQFVPATYALSVMEGAVVGSTLYTFTVQDDDTSVNAQYDLAITSGNTGLVFTLAGDELRLAGSLDYETTQQYQLMVTVTDRGVPPLSANSYIIVNVLSQNEHPPVFLLDSHTVTFAEDIAIGATLYNADASDLDLGKEGDLRYSIIAGNPGDTTFLIDPVTGVITTGSYLDFDVPPNVYSLNVSVTDNAGIIGPTNLYDYMQLTVVLTDVNDNVPSFTLNTYTQSINENIGGSQSVIAVTANDADSGLNGDILYNVQSGDGAGQFIIDPSSGVISTDVAQTLDYDTKPSYTLMIRAVDKGTPAKSSYCLVRVNLIDVNNNPPVFNPSNYYVMAVENQPTPLFVANVYATDDDVGVNGMMDFSITVASNPSGHFGLTQSTNNDGTIHTATVLDRETTNQYVLFIEAEDQGSPRLTGTATLTVYVTDLNDNPPIIQSVPYDVSVSEDVPVGHTIMQISATDADTGLSQTLQFSILSGDFGQFFMLTDYGIIKTTTSLDREGRSVYNMVVQVVDMGTPALTATTTTTLSVLDVNDNYPVFSASGPYSVQENVANYTYVGKVIAADADLGSNAVLQYTMLQTITGVPDHFTIEPDTGIIRTNGDALDRETLDYYKVVVRARDDGTPALYTDEQVVIHITDHNDARPVCQHGQLLLSVQENRSPGTYIADLNATDIDMGSNAAVTYTVRSTDTAYEFFEVDAASGVLTLKKIIDRETHAKFDFYVLAKDSGVGGSLEGTCRVVVDIIDENDNTPVFAPSFYSFETAYNADSGHAISQLSATDTDAGLNGQIQFSLAQASDNFAIHFQSGNLTKATTSAFKENEKFIFSVTAKDSGVPTNSATARVRVDAFPPNLVVVSFDMSLTRSMFASREDDFIAELSNTLDSRYPQNVVKLWKVLDDLTQTTLSSSGRKLLQKSGSVQQYITAAIYVVADDLVYGEAGVDVAKEFITSTALLALWQGDPATQAPSSAVNGEEFQEYVITKVRQYYSDADEPWYKQTIWIIVMTCSIIVFLLLLVILILVVACCCRKRKKRQVDERDNRPVHERKNRSPPRSVLMVPNIIQKPKHGPTNNIFMANPWESPNVRRTKSIISNSSDSSRANEMEKGAMPPPDPVNVYYDGKAVDPVTGKTYEYNSQTGERRWLKTTRHQ